MRRKNNRRGIDASISTLLNPKHFLIQRVFITREKKNFRLIAFHRGRLLTDEYYTSARRAKIAFLKFWGYRSVCGGVYPDWSHFYQPEKNWLNVWYSTIIQRRFISLLVNSIYYFVETVFILIEKKGYRLVVLHRGSFLTDEVCETIEDAKRRFLELYGFKALTDNTRAKWSYFYPPDPDWLKNRLNTVNVN